MKLSFLISAFNRPDLLGCCLYSLKCQTMRDFEAIVLDNGTDEALRDQHRTLVLNMDSRFHYHNTEGVIPVRECYWAAEWYAPQAKGDYLCFPSDDSYYVPKFAEKMVNAADGHGWDLVYCNMVFDPRRGGTYHVEDVKPMVCSIDKTGFIVRRSVFPGFKGKPPRIQDACADGMMVVEVCRTRPHGKVNEVLAVHN